MDKSDPRRAPSDAELQDVNAHWDESGRAYDPNRGDHVDVLNDTTPPPVVPRPPKGQRAKKKRKHWPWVVLFLLLVAAAGSYYWFNERKVAAPAKPATSQPVGRPSQPAAAAIVTKHYDSPTYNLGLDYPQDWQLADTATKLTITSPAMELTNASGLTVSGYVQVMVRNKQTSLAEFSAGAATAVLESQKISYKQPTPNQRAQTYLSFLNYASSKTTSLDAIYVAGDNGYQVGQGVPMSDVIQTDPLVSVSFLNCASTDCSGTPTPLNLATTAWKDTNLSKPILTILTSLTLN